MGLLYYSPDGRGGGSVFGKISPQRSPCLRSVGQPRPSKYGGSNALEYIGLLLGAHCADRGGNVDDGHKE